MRLAIRPLLHALLLALLGGLPLAGCSSENGDAAPAAPARASRRRRRPENPLAFAAETLEGWRYDFAERNARRRVIVYLVDVTAQDAEAMTAIAQRLHEQRHRHHFEIVGVAVPPGYEVLSASRIPRDRPSRAELARLARRHLERAGAMFPCVLDPDAAIVERYVKGYGLYKLGALPAFYAFEPRALRPAGRPIFATHGQPSPEHAAYIERRVLKRFGIEQTTDVDPLVGHHPPAPDVTVTDLRGEPHRLADYRGRVVVFVLIAEHCSRCKQEMRVLEGMLGTYGHGRRPEPPWLEVLAVCVDASGDDLRELVAERGYTATVGADPDWSIRSAFRYRGATPDTFVIDPHGRIRFRHRGYLDDDEPVLHMEIRTLLGLDTRPLLDKGRYAGDRACRVCHERQHADWTLTRHACAWETLVRLGKQDDPKCARCHVVGFGQRGGFVSERRTPGLRDVQCESCHGRNGCAAFAGGQAQPVTAATCTPCHDPVHSPRFDLETYRPRVLHNRAATLAKLPRAERQQRLARLCSTTNAQLFDRDIPYVGSAACGACHPTAYKALQDGVHARALTLLARPARDHWSVPRHKRGVTGLRKPQCVRCHVTGFGRPGGYPQQPPAQPLEHPLAGVGCEACHGPGQAHADDPKQPGAIARLGGTCPECHLLPICRRCHDDANDPDFHHATALPQARHPVGKALSP